MPHPPPPSTSCDVDPHALDWELERLQAPTAAELRIAHRAGVDPNVLLVRFRERYAAALAKDVATINAIVGEDAAGPQYHKLMDHLNEYAAVRREEWWVTPVEVVAALLAPGTDTHEVGEMARRSMFVGLLVRVSRPIQTSRQVARERCGARARGAGRPRAQATRSSAASGDSGDDDGPGEPPAAPLRLAPPARAVLTFGCLTAAERGEAS